MITAFLRKIKKPLAPGLQEGEQRKAPAMARNMIAEGEPAEKTTRYTGLTREEVENLVRSVRAL
jgi:hypothetical protein